MAYGRPDNSTTPSRRSPRWAIVAATLLTIPVAWLILASVDVDALGAVWQEVLDQPFGLLLAVAAFGVAFILRAVAWIRVLPDLSLGQSWAGLHLALGANHLLPLRLGEPFRVVSVVRRAGIDWQRATASTLTLRAGDLVSIGIIGAVAGLGTFSAWWATAAIVLGGGIAVAAGVVWLNRLSRTRDVSLPGPLAIGATVAAWAFEAVVVYQAAGWAGVDLSFSGAVLVTSAAVAAQVAAFAPGGLGTYEAGGMTAMVFLGVEPATALAVVLTAHAVKTAYSLLCGLRARGHAGAISGHVGTFPVSRDRHT